MIKKAVISNSSIEGKRYKVVLYDKNDEKVKTVNFGSKGGSTFLEHKDLVTRQNWLNRHSKLNEDWSKKGMCTAGFWSRWFLWEKKTLKETIAFMQKKYNIKIIMRRS